MKQGSYLERLCESIIRDEGFPQPIKEYRFTGLCGKRRYRFDYLWVDKRVVLEVEGGIWIKGAHSTGTGIIRDIEKHNQATLMGFKVIRVTKKHIENNDMVKWLKIALYDEIQEI